MMKSLKGFCRSTNADHQYFEENMWYGEKAQEAGLGI